MAGDSVSNGEARLLVMGFPAPGPMILKAYYDLWLTQNGTEEEKRRLGNPANLPHPWDPPTCTNPRLRWELWRWLDAVAGWINAEYVWEPNGSPVIPDCWPLHPHIVHELAVLADQRRQCTLASNSDRLENWHRIVLPGFLDRMKLRLNSHCEDAHQPWPARSRHARHTGPDAQRARADAFEADLGALYRDEELVSTRPQLALIYNGDDRINPETGEFV